MVQNFARLLNGQPHTYNLCSCSCFGWRKREVNSSGICHTQEHTTAPDMSLLAWPVPLAPHSHTSCHSKRVLCN